MPRKADTTATEKPSAAPPPEKSPAEGGGGHKITRSAEAAICAAAERLHVTSDALVDLAVREWVRAFDPDLLP